MRDDAIVVPRAALRRLALLVLALVALATLAAVVWQQRDRLAGGILSGGIASQVDRGAYQAVFLTGGQVYFGRLAVQDDYFLLSDIFYIADAKETLGTQQAGQLVKRGSELHGPKDPMLIPRDKVLFVENMRDDSEVVAVIRQSKSGQGAPRSPVVATARPSPSATR